MNSTKLRQLAATNLNQLPALAALLSTCSVSQAALHLGISQPAMSNTLKQLREVFADPLLVRHGNAMIRTPRGELLNQLVTEVLRSIENLIDVGTDFDPAVSERKFIIGARDYIASGFLSALVQCLCVEAPGMSVRIANPLNTEALARGIRDLVIAPPDLPVWRESAGLMKKRLYTDSWVCLTRVGHPAVKHCDGNGDSEDHHGGEGYIPLENYLAASHVRVSIGVDMPTQVDIALDKMGEQRHCVLSVAYFAAVPALVASSDLIAVVPKRCGTYFQTFLPIQLYPPPIPLADIPMAAIWHSRSQEDPAHRWLRNKVFAHIGE